MSTPSFDGSARRPVQRAPSQVDVARLAGVSAQTVSRVANNSLHVEQLTRQRVLAAMRELGYRPNSAARALATGRSGSIGVVAFSIGRYDDAQSLDALAQAARDAGYSISLFLVQPPAQGGVSDVMINPTYHAVDGLVIVRAEILQAPQVLVPPGLPVVIRDDVDGYPYPTVALDQAEGARSLMEHLVAQGHKTVWHISGPPTSLSAQIREQTWMDVLAEHGLPVPPVLRGDWSAHCGYEVGQTLARNKEVTAVFCANDRTALGFMRALHEAGRAVPQDVVVAGFDDIPEAGNYWPPLSTVRQDFAKVGHLCIQLLLDQLESPGSVPAQRHGVPVTMVLRDSTDINRDGHASHSHPQTTDRG